MLLDGHDTETSLCAELAAVWEHNDESVERKYTVGRVLKVPFPDMVTTLSPTNVPGNLWNRKIAHHYKRWGR